MHKPSSRVSLAWLLPLALVAGSLQASDTSVAPADPMVLDFMADWQGSDGQWVDPMTFARIDPAKVRADDAKRHGKTPIPAPVSDGAPAAASRAVR